MYRPCLLACRNGLPAGKVFIGLSTHQTTGMACHIHCNLVPTVERENIDLQVWRSDDSLAVVAVSSLCHECVAGVPVWMCSSGALLCSLLAHGGYFNIAVLCRTRTCRSGISGCWSPLAALREWRTTTSWWRYRPSTPRPPKSAPPSRSQSWRRLTPTRGWLTSFERASSAGRLLMAVVAALGKDSA